MGKTTFEKIIYVAVASLIAFALSMAATKSTLLNGKADTPWVEKKEREIYEYIDKRDDEIKMTHSKDIDEIKKGQDKILDYIMQKK